mgnify:CR=1 FL=1
MAQLALEADAVCGAAYGTQSPERTNRRNGYRAREFDTRAGTLDLAVPNSETLTAVQKLKPLAEELGDRSPDRLDLAFHAGAVTHDARYTDRIDLA